MDIVSTKGWPFCKRRCPKTLRKNAKTQGTTLQPRHGWGSFWSRKCRTGKRLAPDDTMFSCSRSERQKQHTNLFGKFWFAKHKTWDQQEESPHFRFEWSNLLLAIFGPQKKNTHTHTLDTCLFHPRFFAFQNNRNIKWNHPQSFEKSSLRSGRLQTHPCNGIQFKRSNDGLGLQSRPHFFGQNRVEKTRGPRWIRFLLDISLIMGWWFFSKAMSRVMIISFMKKKGQMMVKGSTKKSQKMRGWVEKHTFKQTNRDPSRRTMPNCRWPSASAKQMICIPADFLGFPGSKVWQKRSKVWQKSACAPQCEQPEVVKLRGVFWRGWCWFHWETWFLPLNLM